MKSPHLLASTFLAAAATLFTPAISWADEAAFLTGIRQLTFEGKRAGEGYFSADGKKMIFQSEREADNPFYQIYLMDLETGDQRRVSPGFGKTTCAWMYPDGNRILFASTHLDPEAKAKQDAEFKERQSNRVRKYSWDYDEHFDLFSYSLSDNKLTQLTSSTGYDAEGAVSPDGRQIVFASNRAAYEGQLSASDAERLKIDKQYFMDIYVMNADGTNVRRLTDVPGYDGGPFFSADGSRICWRRFDEKGMTAEIHTMKVDGSDQRQITKVGAMSWAPFFHPSGDYLIFTNNVNGFANFELYVVDALGKHDPVRITETDGFDGLPVFSPDGKKLSWTSGRTTNNNSQIFIADWNDAAARKALGIEKSGAGAVAENGTPPKPGTVEKPPGAPDLSTTSADITPADMKQHITYLASDALQGRLTGTQGEKLATEYMASVFQQLGLVPFGDDNTYYSNFDFTAGVALGQGNKMELTGSPQKMNLVSDQDWRPLSFSQTGDIPASEIVFAGYGIETPDNWTDSNGKKLDPYSSYFHLDVKDKWVLVLRYLPENLSQDRRNELLRFTSLRHKALTARQKGARGIIIASGPNSKVVEQLVPLTFDASLASSGIAAVSVTDATADRILSAAETGKTLVQLQTDLDKGDSIQGIPLGKLKLSAHIAIAQEKKQGRNVLAVLCKGTEPDFHTAPIIIGAHIDHLGTNGGSSSRAKGDEVHKIHHGADDNASGSAGVLEIAQWLVDMKKQGKLDQKRDILFAAWSGEELGLLGSTHFCESLAKMIKGDPNAKLTGMLAAVLNMDMIGRFNKNLVLQGVGSSSWWPREIEQRNAPLGLPITTQSDAHLATDSTTFYTRGIPTLNAFTGAHEDYHMPSDTADKINFDKAAQVAKFMGLVTRSLSTTFDAPDYIAMEAPKNQGTRTGLRVYLGTIPDYAQGDIKGVKLSGVSPVGPAAKAGVKSGDIITKLGEKDIQNIYDYTYVMGELKIGKETTIIVQRDGKPVELKITPGSRD
ncbi:M28 family peptidase [Roseimicrobium sp. ORNL1]|uniref:M28 family peptidase n=1 Tax=Roseimicrobium sp. ORNL1 TaxID=2711231 RepID=UPI0013E1F5DE|nr:M28 family peptidase [Roseimicrobium sp. ORNL1]QIF05842.1 M28 family peptidase [Roseimicrobium sp. ORNL1]